MQIKIDEDFKNLLPELTSEEYTNLEKSIVKFGVLSPLIVWNGFLVDGHNRYAICQAHHIDNYQVKEIQFDSRALAMKWILDNQAARRNLSKTQLVNAWSKYEAECAKDAKAKHDANGGDKVSASARAASSNLNSPVKIRTAAEVAAKIGVSENTYRDMKFVTINGTEEQKERMNKGGRGNGAHRIAEEIKNDGVAEGMKRCKQCGKIKPIDQFQRDVTKKDGYKKLCKECINPRQMELRRRKRAYGEVSDQQIIGGLYDDNRSETTIQDVVNEFMTNFKQYMNNLVTVLASNKGVVDENPEDIAKMWSQADALFQTIRRGNCSNV